MAKTKITKKQLPLLKRDIDLDEETLKKLKTEQDRFNRQFKDRIEEVKSETLKRYNAKIEVLTTAKTESTKAYDEEIKLYKTMLKDLGGEIKRDPTKKATSTKGKTQGKTKK